jgi:lipoic acid synthetase
LSRIPVKVVQGEVLKKPDWIRVKAGSPTTRFYEIKDVLRSPSWSPSAKKPVAPTLANVLAKVRPRS